jgi:protein SMG6
LAVITELDGISANQSELGRAASSASQYVTDHIRSHSSSLKVQTSRGNYLTTLNVRSENFDFLSRDQQKNGERMNGWERSLDDLILRAALWQETHWVDRSSLLTGISSDQQSLDIPHNCAKVVLLSFDRNLRLKARARQLNAGDERDLAHILRVGSS